MKELHLTIDDDTDMKLKALAAESGDSRSKVIRKLVAARVANEIILLEELLLNYKNGNRGE